MKKSVATLLTVVVAAATAIAQEAPAPTASPSATVEPSARFKKLDKDGDGKLTFEEFKGITKTPDEAKLQVSFKKRDKNKDGSLTPDELDASKPAGSAKPAEAAAE